MSKRTATWLAIVFGTAFVVATQVPHVWAVYAQSRGYAVGKVYTGVLPTSAEDALSYYGWMRQGQEGEYAFADRFTVEEHPELYVNIFYGPLGWIAGVTGASIPAVYAAARVAAAAALLAALWWFAGLCFERRGVRLACFAMAAVSGGWEGPYNWLVRNRGWEPVSSPGWWTPEISTFFSTMTIPHFDAAFALQVLAVGFMVVAWRGGAVATRFAAASGATLLGLVFFHPYEVVTCAAVFAFYPLLAAAVERRAPWRDLRLSAVPMAMVAPAILWNAWLFSLNPAFRAMDEQAVMTTPELSKLALALGASGLLAVGALFGVRRMTPAQRVAAAWFVGSLFAAHLPFRFQRRLLGGIQLPIAVLAAFVLATWVVPWLARRMAGRARVAAALLVLVMVPLHAATPYYLRDIEWRQVRRFRHPTWIAVPDRDLLSELDRRTGPDEAVLASHALGMLVPGLAGVHTFVGHYSLTIDSEAKSRDVARFFGADTDDAWRRDLVARWGLDYVLWTSHERALGAFDPASVPWLEEVARFGESDGLAVLYRVVFEASTSPSP